MRLIGGLFYHIKNLQSTKTQFSTSHLASLFYHIKNLQSTKTLPINTTNDICFITLRIYKVLKLLILATKFFGVLSH